MAKKPDLRMVPAAARASSPARRETQLLDVEAIRVFEQALGGREALTAVLATGADDPAVEQVLVLLLDPTTAAAPLPKLCALAGLTVADLFKAFHKASLMRGQIRVAAQLEAQLPGVIADLLRRAQPYDEPCTACGATGTTTPEPTRKVPNPAPGPCGACGGKGQIHVLPDLERQKVVLDLAELLKKGSGISVSQNVINAPAPASGGLGSLEQLQQVVSDALYKSPTERPTVEAEVVDPVPAGSEGAPQA